MAASAAGRLYVVGGYGAERSAFAFFRGRWHGLRRLPAPRAAAGAAVVGRRLYVVGGVVAPGRLAPRMLVLDLLTGRWSFAPGLSPREHLAVTAASPPSRPTHLPGGSGWRCPRFPIRAGVPARPSSAGESSRWAERNRPGRSHRFSRTTSRLSTGHACPTCGRRGTGSRSPRSGTASTRSPAGRSPGCTSARRTSF
ncbi:MAG: hypothetical protein E6G02_13050 [Actinobacteria bacterium]|nr:MAG: hypothetical protein E6G02_13050 [Actinomycetota bacterium]